MMPMYNIYCANLLGYPEVLDYTLLLGIKVMLTADIK